MHIVLVNELGNDHGVSVDITEPFELTKDGEGDGFLWTLVSPEGTFERSANYWEHSPYGWKKVKDLTIHDYESIRSAYVSYGGY